MSGHESSSLLRLVKSDVFDIYMAVWYLFNSTDRSVLSEIGETVLYRYDLTEILVHLPLLVKLYINSPVVSDCLHSFLVHCCRHSEVFASQCLIYAPIFAKELTEFDTCADDRASEFDMRSDHLTQSVVRQRRLSWSNLTKSETDKIVPPTKLKATQHLRSQSDVIAPWLFGWTSGMMSVADAYVRHLPTSANGQRTDLDWHSFSCRQFRTNKQHVECRCDPADKMTLQTHFLSSLATLAYSLNRLRSKKGLRRLLRSHVNFINSQLPAKVALPFIGQSGKSTIVTRIQSGRLLPSAKHVPVWLNLETQSISDADDGQTHVQPVIVKCGSDLMHEVFAAHCIRVLDDIWRQAGLPLQLRPYSIVMLTTECGLIEALTDVVSVDEVKKVHENISLADYFRQRYIDVHAMEVARRNFVESLAAYSLLTYLIQLKDRHNGNLMISDQGHVVHVDFGFILASGPGDIQFEMAPFKLTKEFVELMGGKQGDLFLYYKTLLFEGLVAARKHSDRLLSPATIASHKSNATCFYNSLFSFNSTSVVDQFRARFHIGLTDDKLRALVTSMVDKSLDSLSTQIYDKYQYLTNGIR